MTRVRFYEMAEADKNWSPGSLWNPSSLKKLKIIDCPKNSSLALKTCKTSTENGGRSEPISILPFACRHPISYKLAPLTYKHSDFWATWLAFRTSIETFLWPPINQRLTWASSRSLFCNVNGLATRKVELNVIFGFPQLSKLIFVEFEENINHAYKTEATQ